MDTLAIDLVVEDGKASVALDNFKSKLQATGAEMSKMAGPETFSSLEARINKAIVQASNLRQGLSELRGVNVGDGGLSGLDRVATLAAGQVTQTRNRLVEIQAAMARTTDAKALDGLINDARVAEAELDRLQAKINRVAAGRTGASGSGGAGLSASDRYGRINLARQGADVFTSAAMGMDPMMIAIQQGPQILDAMASSGIKFNAVLAKLGTSAASLGALLGVGAAAIGVSYAIFTEISKEAESRYRIEERIQGVYNKQALALKAIANEERNIQEAKNKAVANFLFSEELERASDSPSRLMDIQGRLRREIDSLNREKSYDKYEKLSKEDLVRIDSEIERRRAEIGSLEVQIVKASRTGFTDQDSGKYPVFERMMKTLAEEQAKWNKSVEDGKKKAEELGKAWTSAFSGLFGRLNSNNPFFDFMSRSTSEAEKLKESLKGLPPELQKVAIAMKAAAEGKDLFALRIDTALAANNLRFDAENFRNPFDPAKNKKLQDQIIERFLANNPNYFFDGSDKAREAILSRTQIGRNSMESPADRFNKKLEEQYDLIYRNARTPEQMRAADRAWIAATQGANPLDMSDKMRDAASDARIRQAGQLEAAEKQAKEDRQAELRIREKFANAVDKLDKIAGKEGLAGVNRQLEIDIKDSTSDRRVRNATTATPDDVAFIFGGFGISGGSNR